MAVYLINIALMMLGYFIWIFTRKFKRGRLYFCIQATAQWILLSGLRSVRVGADTERYKIMFEEITVTSWGDIFSDFGKWFLGSDNVKDPGYSALQKIFQYFSTDYQVFLFFVAILFMVPVGIWIYRNSKDTLMSFVIFSTLFYSFFAITGIRQTLVTGIAVFLGEELLKKKKYVWFYAVVLLMIPIHKSAIALLVFPFLRKLRLNALIKVGAVGIMGLAFIFREPIMSVLSGIVGYEEYDKFIAGAGASTFAFLYYAMILFGLLLYESVILPNKGGIQTMNYMIIGAVLLPLTFINPSAMRAVQYFSVYLMLFVPYVMGSIKKPETRTIVSCIGMAALVFLLIRNNPSYTFFWQV